MIFRVSAAPERRAYLDNLRSLVILLVVAMHSNVTYSGFGSWYYTEGAPSRLDPLSLLFFGFYGSFTQAWFMGCLFFCAGFFAARSLAKRGSAAFLKERLFRLGAPLLAYALIVSPFIFYFQMDYAGVRERLGFPAFWASYLASFRWAGSTGPLWFAETLLFFCAVYALVRTVRPVERGSRRGVPGLGGLALAAAATGLAAFCVRLYLPVGSSVLNLQFSNFASYIVLFVLGVLAGEGGWFEALAERTGRCALVLSLCAGIPAWGLIMAFGGAFSGSALWTGGLHWQSFAYAFWEAGIAVFFSVGIVDFFRRRLDRGNGASRFLAANSFGVFLLHAPVLIAVSLVLKDWGAPPLIKHACVLPAAYAGSLALSALARRIPFVRSLLK